MEPGDDLRSSMSSGSSGIFSFLRNKSVDDEVFSLDNYLPWRDSSNSLPPQHVNLRSVTGTSLHAVCVFFWFDHDFFFFFFSLWSTGNEAADEVAMEDVPAAASDQGVMEKILRGFLSKGGSDQVGPLEAHVKAVTGESVCLKISSGACSDVSSKIMNQLKQAQAEGFVESLSLDRVVQHMHIRSATLAAEHISHPADHLLMVDDDGAVVQQESENVIEMPPKHSVSSPAGLGGAGASMLLGRIPQAVLSCRRLTSLIIEVPFSSAFLLLPHFVFSLFAGSAALVAGRTLGL